MMSQALPPFQYRNSIKSDISDEPINVFLQRPIAGVITWLLYYTPATPNVVTLLSTCCGVTAGILLMMRDASFPLAASMIYLKDLLDSADGQLARAKQLSSRRGRFYDSIGDFVVDVLLFIGMGITLWHQGLSSVESFMIAIAGFLGINLRVSYYVFYQSSFLHQENLYLNNRITEEVRAEDLEQDATTLRLQRIFQMIYGWQDRLMLRIDSWSFRPIREADIGDAGTSRRQWYSDPIGLRLSGTIGLGTEFVILAVCLFFSDLQMYFIFNLCVFNCIWLMTILYRRLFLSQRIIVKMRN